MGFSRSKLLLKWWILATIFCFVNFLSLFFFSSSREKKMRFLWWIELAKAK